jgi:hypothetical protein
VKAINHVEAIAAADARNYAHIVLPEGVADGLPTLCATLLTETPADEECTQRLIDGQRAAKAQGA